MLKSEEKDRADSYFRIKVVPRNCVPSFRQIAYGADFLVETHICDLCVFIEKFRNGENYGKKFSKDLQS